MKAGKIALSILAGAGVGALLGILYAPQKGTTTRRNIGNRKDDFADSMKDKLNEVVDSYSKKYEKAYLGAETLIAEGKAKFNEFKKGSNEELA